MYHTVVDPAYSGGGALTGEERAALVMFQ